MCIQCSFQLFFSFFLGTGKTFFSTTVASISSLPKYVVNGSLADFPESKFTHIDYDDLEDLENCFVIIEDVVRPSDAEAKILNNLLVKIKRHKHVVIHMLMHSIVKQNLSSLVQHFDVIVFSHCFKTRAVFKYYAKRHYAGDPEGALRIWDSFIASSSKTHYLMYNVPLNRFTIVDSKGLIILDKENEIRMIVERCMRPFPNHLESLSLFEFLFAALPAGSLDLDLTLTVKTPLGEKTVSIIDLLGFVTNPDSPDPPNYDIVRVFHVLQDLYSVPYLFIRNIKFLK